MNPGLIEGFEALSLCSQSGFSSACMDGHGYLAVTTEPETQIKDSSETAFLAQAFNATNFWVYKNTIAKKITFDRTTATGVELETGGLSDTVKAAKEVAVSAGTPSAQMLMVFVIVPREILAQQNVPLIVDRPVRQNWQVSSHVPSTRGIQWFEGNAALEGDKLFLQQATREFLQTRTGPFTNWEGDILGFEKLAFHGPQAATSSCVTLTPVFLAVTSKGTIGLDSADP
ncbi:MAG: hypothetical protein Q9184_003322 [Pyrenodesmia sp. 2 TL-2023]